MSDPVKNAEIEDVLSSIRRLVSENHVGTSRSSKPAAPQADLRPQVSDAKAETAQQSADRLVLSPALRVETDQAAARAAATSPVEDTPFANSLKEDIHSLRESLPSFLQQRLDPLEVEAEEETEAHEEAPFETDIDTLNFAEDISAIEDDEQGNTVLFPAPDELTFETARAAEPTPDHTGAETSNAKTRPWEIDGERLAEWHSVRTEEAEHFEPDGPEDGANAGTPVATLNWEDHEAEASDAEEVAPVRPKMATVDPVVEEIADAVTENIAPSEDTIDAQQYDAVLDEEMLRELVGEIVRQELQGPLGERITRNVRKLVRREINRALTARNFNDG